MQENTDISWAEQQLKQCQSNSSFSHHIPICPPAVQTQGVGIGGVVHSQTTWWCGMLPDENTGEHHLKPPLAILMERSCKITWGGIRSTGFEHCVLTPTSLFQEKGRCSQQQQLSARSPIFIIYTSMSPSTAPFQFWYPLSSINSTQIIITELCHQPSNSN